ncbi:hypothetical protein RB196_32655 [Streptomyces sp. PmtA]
MTVWSLTARPSRLAMTYGHACPGVAREPKALGTPLPGNEVGTPKGVDQR